MSNHIRNIDAVRTIDTIIHLSKVSPKVENRQMTSTSEQFSNLEHDFDSKEFLEQIVEEAKEALKTANTQLSFQIHERTGRPYIQLIESDSQRVIREIPPEKMLDIVAGIWEWAGIIVDRKE